MTSHIVSGIIQHEMKGDDAMNLPELPDKLGVVLRETGWNLPCPDQVSYYELEKERKLYVEGEIDSSVLALQRLILRWNSEDKGIPREDRRPIRLYIWSRGGDVDSMWSLIDTIELSGTPVYTVNVGMAESAAALIFLAGHRRYMLPRAHLMIHEGSAKMVGDSVKVLDASENYRKTIQKMREYILSRTRISASVLGKQKNHDWEIDAKYCLEHGACEEIVTGLDDVI